MKNILTLILSLLIVGSGEAQRIKKPNLNKAKTLWLQGKLDEAKTMIDAATTHEKTKNNGKTWYYRGLIYATIDTTSNEVFRQLSDNPREVAMSSFTAAKKIDKEGSKYFMFESGDVLPVSMEQQINGYYGYYFGLAIQSYEKEEIAAASKYFEIAWTILPTDTSAVLNAAHTAKASDDNDRAFTLFGNALELGVNDISVYYSMIYMLNEKEDFQGVLDLTRKAKESHPNDLPLIEFEVSALLKLGKVDEVMAELTKVVENDPSNLTMRLALALLYDQEGKQDQAVATYQQILEVDSNHFESNYNLAVITFSNANEAYKELTKLTTAAEDRKKEKVLLPEIRDKFNKSMPLWEKVHEIKNDDVSALQALNFIYNFLQMDDKANQMAKKLAALEER